MTWDRYELGQKNIFYDEKKPLIPVNVFPPHVERVRRLITDFSCVVNGEALVNKNELIADDTLKLFLYGPVPDPALVAAQKTLIKAHSLVNGGYKEERWQAFYETNFFERLAGSLSSSKDDTRRHTAQYAVKLPKHAQIPPIPVITTIGPSVTVWIMYYATDFDAPCSHRETTEEIVKRRKEGCIMRVIWNGDMTKLADVVMFQMILDNAHTWATRAFKPLISSYIEQWQHVFDESTVSQTSGHSPFFLSKKRREKTIEQRRAILPIVQGLLDDQAAMELDDMANKKVTPLLLGLMMHQICSLEKEFITSEVDRVVSQKLEGLSMKGLAAGKQHSCREGENASSQAHPDCYSDDQESIFGSRQTSQFLVPDSDDPNDSDYRPSQESSAPAQMTPIRALGRPHSNSPDALPSGFKFSFYSSVRGVSKGSEGQPSGSNANRLLNGTDGGGRETPSISGGQATPKPSVSTLLFRALSSDPGSLAGNISREISEGTTPSGSPIITGQSSLERQGWSPGRQSGQPNPPQPDSPLEASSEKSQFQKVVQDESDYIDLTRDSQEVAS
ncbi:hypothetical protein FGADI_1678 [Fusarium gaditjirri]|uniref:Uncharacterized protein n=1 Tax=Fusarium gaditjirri TaxID=282569 RepID=A0A8H4TKM4_9HYPO|nr:hypothetical protein FGADI_1678 [Fusarium gaditjirri]